MTSNFRLSNRNGSKPHEVLNTAERMFVEKIPVVLEENLQTRSTKHVRNTAEKSSSLRAAHFPSFSISTANLFPLKSFQAAATPRHHPSPDAGRAWARVSKTNYKARSRLDRSQLLQANNKCAIESSRRDLHNALLCTALKSHFFLKQVLLFCQKMRKLRFKILTFKRRQNVTL